MGFLTSRENHGGPLKTPHEKTGFVKYASIYFSHFWRLMALNFIYVLFCIPVITIGPATAALTKVCRNFAQERHAYLFADFFDAFKKNFKQGVALGLIDTLFVVIFGVGIPYYIQWASMMPIMYIPMFLSFAFMLVVIMMNFYAYIMICSTNLTFKQIIKNSLILVYLGMKKSIICLLAYVFFMSVCILFLPISVVLIVTLPFSFVSFLSCGLCYPVVRKYIIQPYYDMRGEENPELEYLDTDEERVFKDAPEYKTKEQKKAQKTKKKVVK